MRKSIGIFLLIILGVCLSACKGQKLPAEEVVSKEPPQITAPTQGKEYEISDKSHVLATYEQYNIQAPVEKISEELWKEEYLDMTFMSHKVSMIEEETADFKMFDVADTVVVEVKLADVMGILPQTMEQVVTYKRDTKTSEWKREDAFCKKWDIEYKKLGGTAWQKRDQEKEVFLRFRDTIEFFHTKVDSSAKNMDTVYFDTTILGAMATIENGQMVIERIHIASGTISDKGEITLTVEIYDMEKQAYKKEKQEIKLSDYKEIEKTQLPFSEEEYKEVAAW